MQSHPIVYKYITRGTLGLSTLVNALYRGIIALLGEFCQNWVEACGSGSKISIK